MLRSATSSTWQPLLIIGTIVVVLGGIDLYLQHPHLLEPALAVIGLGPDAKDSLQLQLPGSRLPNPPPSQLSNVNSKCAPATGQALYMCFKEHASYMLPEVQLRKGLVYMGSAFRLRRVLHHMLLGKQVKIGVIGGSISWGHGASMKGQSDWVSLMRAWLKGVFGPKVIVRNGCIPATPSSYMVMCLEMSVDSDVDLVFVEYNLNDGMHDAVVDNRKTYTYERLMRRLLALPKRPAVILLQMPSHGIMHPRNGGYFQPFLRTNEDLYGALAQYYDIQWLSFRTTTYRLDQVYPEQGINYTSLCMIDFLHPVDSGHRVMTDMAIYLLERAAAGLAARPWGWEDERMQMDMPEPMIPGNYVPEHVMCAHMEYMRPLVYQAVGFEWLVEGAPFKPKPGYVSGKPGSVLRIKIDTTRSQPRAAAGKKIKGMRKLGEEAEPGMRSEEELEAKPEGQPVRKLQGKAGDEAKLAKQVQAAQQQEEPTSAPPPPPPGGAPVKVALAYLRSYTHMGKFTVSCESGCQCVNQTADGHHTTPVSQTYLVHLVVTQSPDCILAVTVLRETSSGEHKVKISGIMITDTADVERENFIRSDIGFAYDNYMDKDEQKNVMG